MDRLSLTEAAALLKLGYTTVLGRVLRGEYQGGKDSRGWFVEREAVDRELRQRPAATQTAPGPNEAKPAA